MIRNIPCALRNRFVNRAQHHIQTVIRGWPGVDPLLEIGAIGKLKGEQFAAVIGHQRVELNGRHAKWLRRSDDNDADCSAEPQCTHEKTRPGNT
jgi:hypothetical protein